jgi:hypothetical protein
MAPSSKSPSCAGGLFWAKADRIPKHLFGINHVITDHRKTYGRWMNKFAAMSAAQLIQDHFLFTRQ